jgi:hypothetical protein
MVRSGLVVLSHGLASGVFDVADRLMRGTLGLVELAFDLHLLVAGHLVGRVLESALRLTSCRATEQGTGRRESRRRLLTTSQSSNTLESLEPHSPDSSTDRVNDINTIAAVGHANSNCYFCLAKFHRASCPCNPMRSTIDYRQRQRWRKQT